MDIIKIQDAPQYLFSSIFPDSHNLSQFSSVMNELIPIYSDYFGKPVKKFHLINDYSNDQFPMTCRETDTIYVNCPLFDYRQFIYQVTHELCHWMIPGTVDKKLRWLEESISVLASLYFSDKIKSVDQEKLSTYIENETRKSIDVDFQELFIPGSKTLLCLEYGSSDFTDYPRYKSIAKKMLSDVKKNPLFWKAVPTLCHVIPDIYLENSLDSWLKLAPIGSVHDALSEVISSFKR